MGGGGDRRDETRVKENQIPLHVENSIPYFYNYVQGMCKKICAAAVNASEYFRCFSCA